MEAMITLLILFLSALLIYIWYRYYQIKHEHKALDYLQAEYKQLRAKSELLLEAVKGLDTKEHSLIQSNDALNQYAYDKEHEIGLLEQQISALYDKKTLLEQSNQDYEDNLTKTLESMEQLKRKELADKIKLMEQEYLHKVEENRLEIAEIEQLINDKRALIQAINQQLSQNFDTVQRIELPEHEYNTFKEAVSELQKTLSVSFSKAMNKVLWTELVRQPTTEMVKRLTGGERISGIYKITNTETGWSYIGRSVNVGNRLTEHVRSAIGASSTAQQQVHKEMGKNLLDWEFEILEKVDEDKLGEREKFYIDFYDTVNLGYNRARGG